MSGAREIAEKIEHAAHGDGHGHGGGIGRRAGVTMAILGVMLALCAALVGGARTELVATMVEQSNTWQKYQAQRMKHRMMITQLATLHALSPSREELKKFQDELEHTTAPSGKASSDEAKDVKAAVELSIRSLVEILTPRKEDLARLLSATKRYEEELEAAQHWAESYDEAAKAHSEASEHYEWGQLSAEIGIVIASIALLLSSRKAWYVSVVFGVMSASTLAWTYTSTRGHLHHAEEQIAHTQAKYKELRKSKARQEDDEAILAEIEGRLHGAHLAASAAPAGEPPPAAEKAGAHH